MGESKRRAAFGAQGKITGPVGRGLLFPHLFSQICESGFKTKSIKEEDYQAAILYWDKIACPTNNFFHVRIPNEELLIKENFLIRPQSFATNSLYSGDLVKKSDEGQIRLFSELDKKQPGFWCMTNLSSPDNFINSSEFALGRSVLINLTGALPLPPAKTHVEKLLEFKRGRAAELQRLRAALDDIYLKIRGSTDEDMAMQVAIRELDKSIADLQKSSREWWKIVKLSDVKTMLNLGASAAAGVLGLAASPTVGTILGGAGAILSISEGIKTKLKADRSSPYWYAVSVSKELG
jgi:hypothetical protein